MEDADPIVPVKRKKLRKSNIAPGSNELKEGEKRRRRRDEEEDDDRDREKEETAKVQYCFGNE